MRIGDDTSVIAKEGIGIISKRYGEVKSQEHYLYRTNKGNLVVAMKGIVEDEVVFEETDYTRAFMYIMNKHI